MRNALVCLCLVFSSVLFAADPYEIFQKSIDAVGGIEKLKQETGVYLEGELMASNVSAPGRLKLWEQGDLTHREIDFGGLLIFDGCNGEVNWTLDQNGHVQTTPFEKKLTVDDAMKNFEHLDPESDVVEVEWLGKVSVMFNDEAWNCHKIEIRLKEGVGSVIVYIDDQQWLRRRIDTTSEEYTATTSYSDWREADGIMRPFLQDTSISERNYRTRLTLDKFETNPEIDPSIFEPPADDRDFTFIRGPVTPEIPIVFDGEHLLTEITLEGEDYLFILDTGAGSSVIDAALADSLGLESLGAMRGMGAGGEMELKLVRFPSFELPGVRFDSQQFVALKGLRDMLWVSKEYDVAGILGYDFFSRFVVSVDYAGKTMRLVDPSVFAYSGDGVVIDGEIVNNGLRIPFTADGEEGTWSLDLGAGSSSFHYDYAREHGYDQRTGCDFLANGAGGEFITREIAIDSLSLGGYAVNESAIGVHIVNNGVLAQEKIAGNLGNDILRHFKLYIDFPSSRLVVEPGGDYGKVFRRAGLGMQLVAGADGAYAIKYVSEGTPASEAGFQAGDVVVSVNGRTIADLGGMRGFRDLTRGEPGTTLAFVIRRDGEELTKSATLRDLYR